MKTTLHPMGRSLRELRARHSIIDRILPGKWLLAIALSTALGWAGSAVAALNIPFADGSDGQLVVTSNYVVDLSLAVSGSWSNNNSASAGQGIYDTNQWAVVFKYTNVVIGTGATVTFKNHPSRAPVVWLVNGNVTINGTLSLSGQDYQAPPALAEPGPGGFRGGTGWYNVGAAAAAGFGPGGGAFSGHHGYGASYGSQGEAGPPTYGNPSLLPLMGGSGGAGCNNDRTGVSGGAGGGAILIACSQILSNSGTIKANGGSGYNPSYTSGAGSGGGIRLVAWNLTGAGKVEALGNNGGIDGGAGRIRLDLVSYSGTLQITPDVSPVSMGDGETPLIWLPTNGPTARIVSIGGQLAPEDPRAAFGGQGADVVVPQTNSTVVVVETTNVELSPNTQVKIRMTPRANGNYTETTATNSTVISMNPLVIHWTANVGVNAGYAALQVRVVRP